MAPSPPAVPVEHLPTLLVIDDEIGPRESIRFLMKHECRVLCAESVASGLALLREYPPDAVILDIRMPGQNGIDGLKAIRQIDADVAVIMLTGFAAVGTAQAAIRLEANDYLEKPFDATALRNTVRRQIEQTRLRRKRHQVLAAADRLDGQLRTLQTQERLAELGQNSAEFVHDLRNVLAMVSSSSELLRDEMEALQHRRADVSSEARRSLDVLEQAMRRCVEMLDTWQRLIRHDEQTCEAFDIHALAFDCTEACRPLANARRASLAFESRGVDIACFGDRVQVSRALTNLIHNALHALPPDGGRVCVRSETGAAEARLSVTDTGCGIAEEHLPHLFSPRFTTRRERGGMGLGLFIAQKIAQMHGGRLTVESAVGQGSTFSLLLPRAPGVTRPVYG